MKYGPAKLILIAIVTMAIGSAAVASASNSRSGKPFIVEGKVLQVDRKAHSMLVEDSHSDTLYLVKVPEGAAFRITFGLFKNFEEPDLDHVFKNDRVKMRVIKDSDRLARLEGGKETVIVTAD
ncbi:MAG TPA: hypothetical protein VKM94_21740 [Blastocatellia bacterium]|nr:hypothetical protein [Blastocatellia bacterium]